MCCGLHGIPALCHGRCEADGWRPIRGDAKTEHHESIAHGGPTRESGSQYVGAWSQASVATNPGHVGVCEHRTLLHCNSRKRLTVDVLELGLDMSARVQEALRATWHAASRQHFGPNELRNHSKRGCIVCFVPQAAALYSQGIAINACSKALQWPTAAALFEDLCARGL